MATNPINKKNIIMPINQINKKFEQKTMKNYYYYRVNYGFG